MRVTCSKVFFAILITTWVCIILRVEFDIYPAGNGKQVRFEEAPPELLMIFGFIFALFMTVVFWAVRCLWTSFSATRYFREQRKPAANRAHRMNSNPSRDFLGKRILFTIFLSFLAVMVLAEVVFRVRNCRTATLRDLSSGETQTVSVTFFPHRVKWRITGKVNGTGVVVVPHMVSTQVSGNFSLKGGGDYYDTNASVAFIPAGTATGKIRSSFRFNVFW